MTVASACNRRTVAVVGGGFSGAATAFQLLAHGCDGLEVVLIEPRATTGRGLAYSTTGLSHRLNVPAGRLGLDPASERGFTHWLNANGKRCTGDEFVPRGWLGEYVGAELERMAGIVCTRGVVFSRVMARVRALCRTPSGFKLVLDDGRSLDADAVILATGHIAQGAPALGGEVGWSAAGMVRDPWNDQAWTGLAPDDDVLLVGSGLTAIDVVSTLCDRGHAGRIHLLSRRGLLPQAHRVHHAPPQVWTRQAVDDEPRLRGLLRAVRARSRETDAAGGDWRDVVAGLRAWTPFLWQRLNDREKHRFLRHLQPFWDTHRHRIGLPVHRRLETLLATGQVGVHAGRIERVDRGADGKLVVRWRSRGSASGSTMTVGRIVNCTGTATDLARADTPMLSGLRDEGLLVADVFRLGLQVDDRLRPIDVHGQPVPGLHYIGPLLKAAYWEAVAIPELRVHALAVARHVLAGMAALDVERCSSATRTFEKVGRCPAPHSNA